MRRATIESLSAEARDALLTEALLALEALELDAIEEENRQLVAQIAAHYSDAMLFALLAAGGPRSIRPHEGLERLLGASVERARRSLFGAP